MQKQRDIEVELRGYLEKDAHTNLLTFLQEHGEYVGTKNRIIIDFSTCLPHGGVRERTLDVRARITNGEGEIIIKKGAWGGNEAREEISVKIKDGEFPNLIHAYSTLGLDHGVVVIRKSYTFNYKHIEFALVEIPNHSYFFEAEIMATDTAREKNLDTNHIKRVCAELGLTLFSDQEWFAYVEILNKEANTTFNFAKDGLAYIEKLLKEHHQA